MEEVQACLECSLVSLVLELQSQMSSMKWWCDIFWLTCDSNKSATAAFANLIRQPLASVKLQDVNWPLGINPLSGTSFEFVVINHQIIKTIIDNMHLDICIREKFNIAKFKEKHVTIQHLFHYLTRYWKKIEKILLHKPLRKWQQAQLLNTKLQLSIKMLCSDFIHLSRNVKLHRTMYKTVKLSIFARH